MNKFQYPPLSQDTILIAQRDTHDERLAEILKNNYRLHIRRAETYANEKDRLAERDLAVLTAKQYKKLTGKNIE